MGSVLKMSMDSVSRTRVVYVDMYRTMDTSRVQQGFNERQDIFFSWPRVAMNINIEFSGVLYNSTQLNSKVLLGQY